MANHVTMAVDMARALRLTPQHLRNAITILEKGLPTLRQALEDAAARGSTPRFHYPEARRYLLEGRAGEAGAPSVEGFGDRPYTDLSYEAVADAARGIQAITAAKKAATRRTAGADRAVGASAAEHYLHTAKTASRTLVHAGLFSSDPLDDLRAPQRPGPTRDKALQLSELRGYLRTIITHSTDPLLTALIWTLFRILAARQIEILSLTPVDVSRERPSITLTGKNGSLREMPLHRPVAVAVDHLSASRPTKGEHKGALLRNVGGYGVDGGLFDDWSRLLHEHEDWARNHDIGVHALRHTTARAVNQAFAGDSVPAALFLGHQLPHRFGSTGVYLHSTAAPVWDLRCGVSERVFGPLDRWPELPENDVLRGMLPDGPWS